LVNPLLGFSKFYGKILTIPFKQVRQQRLSFKSSLCFWGDGQGILVQLAKKGSVKEGISAYEKSFPEGSWVGQAFSGQIESGPMVGRGSNNG
jgi:hypothetical protein